MEAWHSTGLAAQQHGEAPWKHLTCNDSEALFKCLPAALHQIRELRCDFLLTVQPGVYRFTRLREKGSCSQRETGDWQGNEHVLCVIIQPQQKAKQTSSRFLWYIQYSYWAKDHFHTDTRLYKGQLYSSPRKRCHSWTNAGWLIFIMARIWALLNERGQTACTIYALKGELALYFSLYWSVFA